jgi:hypothetical protein
MCYCNPNIRTIFCGSINCQIQKAVKEAASPIGDVMSETHQEEIMKYDPGTNKENPYPSHAAQYRKYHGNSAWLYNPWSGDLRALSDIGSDILGILIENQ